MIEEHVSINDVDFIVKRGYGYKSRLRRAVEDYFHGLAEYGDALRCCRKHYVDHADLMAAIPKRGS